MDFGIQKDFAITVFEMRLRHFHVLILVSFPVTFPINCSIWESGFYISLSHIGIDWKYHADFDTTWMKLLLWLETTSQDN